MSNTGTGGSCALNAAQDFPVFLVRKTPMSVAARIVEPVLSAASTNIFRTGMSGSGAGPPCPSISVQVDPESEVLKICPTLLALVKPDIAK